MSEFLWGVATSAYQSEGGYNGPGQPQTNWAAAERRGDVAESGLGADFWNRYPEDFVRCRGLGLNAFRLGIEWSRIQPTYVDAFYNRGTAFRNRGDQDHALADFDKDPILRQRLKEFRHHYGQPTDVRRAFVEAMGISG